MASEEGQEGLTGQSPKAKWGALQRGYVRFFCCSQPGWRNSMITTQMWTDMHARCEVDIDALLDLVVFSRVLVTTHYLLWTVLSHTPTLIQIAYPALQSNR